MDEDALLRAHAPKDAVVTAQPASPPAARRIKRAKTSSAAVEGDFIEDMAWESYQPQVKSPASATASSSASAYFVEKWARPRPAATPCAPLFLFPLSYSYLFLFPLSSFFFFPLSFSIFFNLKELLSVMPWCTPSRTNGP